MKIEEAPTEGKIGKTGLWDQLPPKFEEDAKGRVNDILQSL